MKVEKKKRIVYVVEAFGGGVYTYLKDLINYLDSYANFEIHLIYSKNRLGVDKNNMKEDFPSTICLHQISMKREIDILKDISSIINLVQLFYKINPNIIHLQSSKAGVLGKLSSLVHLRSKKVYYSPHGYSFLNPNLSNLKKTFFYFIEKVFGFIGTAIGSGKTEFLISKKVSINSIQINNGIDIQKIIKTPTKIFQSNKRLKIGTVGRIWGQKNPKLFNEIALNNPDIDFIWIGDGEDKHLLKAKNIEITLWRTFPEVLTIINSLDIYLQTSLYEGLPLSLLYAQCFKKPILASNVIGNKDIVEHGISGYLFNDLKEAKYYLELLKNKDDRKQMGKCAFDSVQERYDINKNYQELIENCYQ